MKKRGIFLVAAIMALCSLFSACGGGKKGKKEYSLKYSAGVNDEGDYDTSLFYRNDLVTSGADPSAIYITEGEHAGYFFTYVTEGIASFIAYKTKDFVDFEMMSVFSPDEESWSLKNYWAPEVIRNPADGKYYMYYSANAKTKPAGANHEFDGMNISVAVSDSPAGPFKEWEGTNALNHTITKAAPAFDFTQAPAVQPLLQDKPNVFPVIDAGPFFDANGDFYMYLVAHIGTNSSKNAIWGCKMLDMVTPDYTTFKKLTEPGFKTPDGEPLSTEQGSNVDEGPFTLRHTTHKPDGSSVTKYYLTYSIYGYTWPEYSVCTAIADSPLGDFVKLGADGRNPLHGIGASNFDHMSGTAHSSIVSGADGELFIAYHAHRDLSNPSGPRSLAFDRAAFVYDENLGIDVIHSNGPTNSLQPLPIGAGAYKNIARDAVVSADSIYEGKHTGLINDGITTVHFYDMDLEFRSNGKVTVTLEFDSYRTVAAIMVYNSIDYDLAFSKLDEVIVETEKAIYKARDIIFPEENISEQGGFIRPGGSAILAFNEIKIKKITITLSQKLPDADNVSYPGIGIADIAVLGK